MLQMLHSFFLSQNKDEYYLVMHVIVIVAEHAPLFWYPVVKNLEVINFIG